VEQSAPLEAVVAAVEMPLVLQEVQVVVVVQPQERVLVIHLP
jgi:hypothetical protein|tara:strand:- start:303 stop:428 length:126 start_codon:yes stop_codon:yes gene_type:complete